MLFSAKAEYACVAMMELAARYGDPRPVRLTDVASKHGISPRFLVQILLQLKGAGLVTSTRGAAGGYALARAPEDVTLFDVVAVIDSTEPTAQPKYRREPTAYVQNVRAVWDRIVQAQQEVLKATTLADLVQPGPGLQYVI
jgi:Rrf2 family protein